MTIHRPGPQATSTDPRPVRLRQVLAPGFAAFLARVVVMVLVFGAIGLVLTHVLDGTALVREDRSLVHRFADARTPTLDRLTGWGTLLADPIPVAVVWAATVAFTAWYTRRWLAPMLVMLSVGGEKLSYFLTTLVVRRPRPDVPTIGTQHVTSSFPSGHVGSAISLYGALAVLIVVGCTAARPRTKVVAAVPVAVIACIVGLCRMYRGHHFLSDVVAGVVIGTTWVVLAARLVPALERREAREGRRGVRGRGAHEPAVA